MRSGNHGISSNKGRGDRKTSKAGALDDQGLGAQLQGMNDLCGAAGSLNTNQV